MAHRFRACVEPQVSRKLAQERSVCLLGRRIGAVMWYTQLDLYDRSWPLWTYSGNPPPPAKFVHDDEI